MWGVGQEKGRGIWASMQNENKNDVSKKGNNISKVFEQLCCILI